MNCSRARRELSAYLDGDLPPSAARGLAAHLAVCAACARRLRSLRKAIELLGELPRLPGAEGIAARVRDRLEVETRGPGLALLLRRFGAARPLILPSLVPAALVLVTVLAGAIALDSMGGPEGGSTLARRDGGWAGTAAASGTEANPLFPSAGVSLPRQRSGEQVPPDVLTQMGEGTLFFETVVARDGTVSAVTLLEGDEQQARPVLDALWRERFEPVHYRGRPVAVSVYRLISRMDVSSPMT